VHDILVAYVVLEGARVMPVIGKLVARRVPQHVRVDWELKFGDLSCPGDHLQKTCGRGRTDALGKEDISRFRVISTRLTQRSDFSATQGMDIIDPALGHVDGRHRVQPDPTAGRTIPTREVRDGTRLGSWRRRGSRSGTACGQPPEADQSPFLSDIPNPAALTRMSRARAKWFTTLTQLLVKDCLD
jgi:hypothetical protein